MTPTTQADLVAELCQIFPSFVEYWKNGRIDDPFPSTSLHSVYQDLLPFLGGASATQTQLARLARLINDAVAFGGDPENAVSTCFLEHLGKGGLAKGLRPLLSQASRSRLHA